MIDKEIADRIRMLEIKCALYEYVLSSKGELCSELTEAVQKLPQEDYYFYLGINKNNNE